MEEEQHSDLSHLIGAPPNLTLGAIDPAGALLGTAGLLVPPKLKQRHKGHVVGVYVTPSARGTGLARSLLDRLVASARASNLILLTLSVSAGNESARHLYRGAGFVSYGTEPNSLKIGSKLIDEELMALSLAQP